MTLLVSLRLRNAAAPDVYRSVQAAVHVPNGGPLDPGTSEAGPDRWIGQASYLTPGGVFVDFYAEDENELRRWVTDLVSPLSQQGWRGQIQPLVSQPAVEQLEQRLRGVLAIGSVAGRGRWRPSGQLGTAWRSDGTTDRHALARVANKWLTAIEGRDYLDSPHVEFVNDSVESLLETWIDTDDAPPPLTSFAAVGVPRYATSVSL